MVQQLFLSCAFVKNRDYRHFVHVETYVAATPTISMGTNESTGTTPGPDQMLHNRMSLKHPSRQGGGGKNE